MKKLTVLLLFLGLLPLSCEKQEEYPYLVMSGFNVDVEHNGQPYQHPQVIDDGDSLVFHLDPTHRYMANASTLYLQNRAWAGAAKGSKGVKYKVDSIQIFAKYPHYGSHSDSDIVHRFNAWYQTSSGLQRGEIEDLIDHINRSTYDFNNGFLTFKQFPDSSLYENSFTIRFWLEGNDWFERKTARLIFKE